MRVGIYNRWLATMGGGEKYSLTIAEYLSRRHAVTVISHTPVDKDLIADRLDLDLSAVEFLMLPERLVLELAPLTEGYDLFINASHMDFIPSRAPNSILVVYFPVPVALDPLARFRRRMGLALRHWLKVPCFRDGAFGADIVDGVQQRDTAQTVQIELPPSRRDYTVNFDLAARDPAIRGAVFFLDGRPLESMSLPPDHSFAHCRVRVAGTDQPMPRELVIQAEWRDGALESASPFKMTLTRFELDHPGYRLYQLLFERWFKGWGLRLHGIPPQTLLDIVDTYDVIWTISSFARKWITRYWNRPSVVLPPPIYVEAFQPGQKRPQILSVGRFFAGSHNKKHITMVQAFKEMVNQGLAGWELHLAGGTTPGTLHREYLQKVHAEARGYPIVIHEDVPFNELRRLYSESAIYWHASGFGEDEDREPIKLEHFGITTVEAMASGCVPVVINKGGQPEIVAHGQNGFLWQTVEELRSLTWQLIGDADLRQRLSDAAIQDSRRFDKAHFQDRIQELIQQMGLT